MKGGAAGRMMVLMAKFPGNSLGISGCLQFELCKKRNQTKQLFTKNNPGNSTLVITERTKVFSAPRKPGG